MSGSNSLACCTEGSAMQSNPAFHPTTLGPEEVLNLQLQRFNLGRKSGKSSCCTFGPLVPPSKLGESKRRTSPVLRSRQTKVGRAAHLFFRIPPTVAAGDGTIAISSNKSEWTGDQSTTRNRVFIVDRYNRNCGILTLMSAIDWPDERLSGVPESPRLHEFVVLNGVTFGASQYHIASVIDSWHSSDVPDMPPPPNRDQRPSEEWRNPGGSKQYFQDLKSDVRNNVIAPVYKVMLVEWKNGIAYRAGLGAIYKSSLDDAVGVEHWKEIVLG
ncbi:MAG: hypothetical protein Q9226_007837 [Calogaya cf. arnoldii]